MKKQIHILENLTDDISNYPYLFELLIEHKTRLENIRKERLKGVMLRSRANWIEHGEKPSKYFCSLEKRNYVNKNVTKIVDSAGNIHTDQNIILNQISLFYQNLYSSRGNSLTDFNFDAHENVPKLSQNESLRLEGNLSYSELTKSLKSSKNGKSPGQDGFTVEFYKFFWKDIGHFSLNHLTIVL